MHMSRTLERRFLAALKVAIAMPRDVAAGMGKAYRTLHSYRDGTRDVTLDAARRLSRFLRRRARALEKAADALDDIISKEEGQDG
jgi:hypothetical protein